MYILRGKDYFVAFDASMPMEFEAEYAIFGLHTGKSGLVASGSPKHCKFSLKRETLLKLVQVAYTALVQSFVVACFEWNESRGSPCSISPTGIRGGGGPSPLCEAFEEPSVTVVPENPSAVGAAMPPFAAKSPARPSVSFEAARVIDK